MVGTYVPYNLSIILYKTRITTQKKKSIPSLPITSIVSPVRTPPSEFAIDIAIASSPLLVSDPPVSRFNLFHGMLPSYLVADHTLPGMTQI